MSGYPDPITSPLKRMDETSFTLLRGLISRAVADAAPTLPAWQAEAVTTAVMNEYLVSASDRRVVTTPQEPPDDQEAVEQATGTRPRIGTVRAWRIGDRIYPVRQNIADTDPWVVRRGGQHEVTLSTNLDEWYVAFDRAMPASAGAAFGWGRVVTTPYETHKIGCHCAKTWAIVDGQWRIVVNGPVPDCPRHGTFARTGTPYELKRPVGGES